ncbi:amino acid transporter AVT1D isoform X2 [Cephus cinctus]|uniref:Amino acid transporter AVT1D isoform X2 n=1 Tax=Cephus cinctus TaxID=211228 RepID=A0AAJ7VZ40_CEPCN|nr:amino acid transporter AVT1D isoform X2 [Cephus cinctus]
MNRENISLLYKKAHSGLSVCFATLCIVDIFGVFPIIALPRAIIQCGWLGIPLVLVVLGLQIYTAALLGKSWTIATALDPNISRKNRYPLAAVTEFTLGPLARTCVTVLLDLTVFGGGIPNLLVASQNLQLFGLKVSQREFDLSYCYWLLIVGVLLCPIMWLGSPRDMKWLASCSCLVVTLTALLIWWCIISDVNPSKVQAIPSTPSWDKFVSAYGMLAFQFDVHPTLMTIQVDMRRPKEIQKAVLLAFLVSGSLFGITAGLAVWKYGGSTTANILQSVPTGITLSAAILLAALQLCLSSAVGHSALFLHLEDQLRVQRSFGWKRCAIRSAVVFLGVAVGESVPRFDIVMALIGGTLTGPLVFLLPPLIYARVKALSASGTHSATPEIYSASERLPGQGLDVVTDPRVHSQSVYYGFLDTKVSRNRYSYVYYDNDQSSECTDYDEVTGDSDSPNDLLLTQQRLRDDTGASDDADAARPLRARRSRNVNDAPRSRPDCDLYSAVDWFGYCIVILGVVITISSTYINVINTIRFVRFTPPCIINATAAAHALNFK